MCSSFYDGPNVYLFFKWLKGNFYIDHKPYIDFNNKSFTNEFADYLSEKHYEFIILRDSDNEEPINYADLLKWFNDAKISLRRRNKVVILGIKETLDELTRSTGSRYPREWLLNMMEYHIKNK